MATDSAEEPQNFVAVRPHKRRPAFDPNCPICPGNEHRTAPEVLRVPSPLNGGWVVRVVPNQFDVLTIDGKPARANYASSEPGGFGIHEVVVETPDHSLSTAFLPEAQLARVWRATKIRYHELSLDSRVEHATILKKHGFEAGASFEHPHSQVIATRMIPPQVSSWLLEAKRHYGKCQECVFCSVLQEELDAKTRIVTTTEHFVALEPFASPTPFCTDVYPRRHTANFGEASIEEIDDLARILHGVLSKIYVGLDDPDFTYNIRTAPVAEAGANYYHWHLSIIPYLPSAVGIENAARLLINSVLPETAAEYLRSIPVAEAIPA